jgi:hypothetical protein
MYLKKDISPISLSKSRVGTSDFDAQLFDIKFWKGDENLRPVTKYIEWLLAFCS